MNRNTAINTACILCALFTAQGCLKDETLDTNRVPIADAKAVGSNGEVVDATTDGGVGALTFKFEGDPLEVTLDGKSSTDLDGTVASYDWRYVAPSRDAGAPASGFWNQSATLDPSNTARPKVLLPMGEHTFTLWVTDDDGAVSAPDTISIKVGGDPVQECKDAAYEMLDDACTSCACAVSAACATAVPACGHDCWGLFGCIASMCPTFTMDMDTQCVIDHCLDFVTGGMTGAMGAGACLAPSGSSPGCATECTPSITAIVTSGAMGS